MDLLGDYLDAQNRVVKLEEMMRERDAEFIKAIERRATLFLVIARTLSCHTCAAFSGDPCRFDGLNDMGRVHPIREKGARLKLIAVGADVHEPREEEKP